MKVLIADDDVNLRKVLAAELREEGYMVEEAECGLKALEMIEKKDFDVLLLDLDLPDFSGQTILRRINNRQISIETVILTGYSSISTAVETMKLGAYDYVTKPYRLNELMAVMEKAVERKTILMENQTLKAMIHKRHPERKFVTRNSILLSVLNNARNFARADFPVIILGESGVGKELLAEEVHGASERAKGPFIPINCGAIAENMIESELFGHEKGAFTSAHTQKPGLLEIANKGSLFLDEIGDLPYNLQRKLLRFIDSKAFYRVGGTKQIEVDVRFVSATNRDLQEEMKKGRFREDLFYRLSTLTLQVPPLRARPEDIPLLVEHIIQHNSNFRMKNKSFSPSALKMLQKYTWPGNVRELQNVIQRTLLLTKNDVIHHYDLPVDLMKTGNGNGMSLQDVERNHILNVLNQVNGKRAEAARILGIDPKTLYRKLLTLRDSQTESFAEI